MRSNPRLDKSSNAAPSHSKEHVSTQTLAVDFNTIQSNMLDCIVIIEIYSKSLGGDMFLAKAL
jgi:hypothetical protein